MRVVLQFCCLELVWSRRPPAAHGALLFVQDGVNVLAVK